MGTVTTHYDIMTRYLMQDQVTGGAARMGESLRRAHTEASTLDTTLKRAAMAAAGFFGFHEMKKHLIDFNSEMEQAKLTTAGFMAMSGLGTFKDNLGEADALVKQYTLDARASIGTTADFVDMSKMMTAAVTRSGGSMKDLHDITKGMVISSKAMGFAPQMAAIEATEALMGNVTIRNRYAQYLLGSIGYGDESGRSRYQALSQEKRLSELKRSLGGDWLKDLASAQEHSMLGATSTFMDNAQLAAMRAGKALFDAIKLDLNQWNEYLIKNGDRIDHIAEVVGHDIVWAFRELKNLTAWLYDHWKEIAVLYTAFKLPQAIAGFRGGLAQGLGSAGAGGAGAGLLGGLATGTLNVPVLTLAAATVYLSASHIEDYFNKKQAWELGMRGETGAGVQGGTMDAAMAALTSGGQGTHGAYVNARIAYQQLKSAGLIDEDGKVKTENMANTLSAMDATQREAWLQYSGLDTTPRKTGTGMGWESSWVTPGYDDATQARAIQEKLQKVIDLALINWDPRVTPFRMEGTIDAPKPIKPDVKITINRMEVISDDPDRLAVGFDELVQTTLSRKGLTPGYTSPAWQRG